MTPLSQENTCNGVPTEIRNGYLRRQVRSVTTSVIFPSDMNRRHRWIFSLFNYAFQLQRSYGVGW